MWTKLDGSTKWHYIQYGHEYIYLCGIERPRINGALALSRCVMFAASSPTHYPVNACAECLRLAASTFGVSFSKEDTDPVSLKLKDQPTFNLPSLLTVSHKRLLILLEGFIGGMHNEFVRNYGAGGTREADGRHISFKTRFINSDGTERIIKGSDHIDIWRWADPEDALFDASFDDKTFITGRYQLGFRPLQVYYNLYIVVMYLQKVHGLQVMQAADIKYDFSAGLIDYHAPMSKERRKFMQTAISVITGCLPVTFTLKSGKTAYHIGNIETADIDVLMSGTVISGANRLPIYRNTHRALCFLENRLGLCIKDH